MPISSPIPGPPQHETFIGSVQSSTPLIYPPPSQTISIILPPSIAPPSIPPPRPQNPAIPEQQQQNRWDPSMPHAQQRRPDLNDQGTQSPNTPFIPPLSLPNGSFPDTPADDAGVTENRTASAGWGPANSQVSPEGKVVRFDTPLPSAHPNSPEQHRHSSWDPSMPPAHQRRPSDPGTEIPNTPFISPLRPRSGTSFDASNYWAGVSADSHDSGWSPANYSAPGPPANDRIPASGSFAGAALQYDGVSPSASWASANYPIQSAPANNFERDRSTSFSGAALRYHGVPNAGAAWGSSAASPWVGMATLHDGAVASMQPITNPSWTVDVYSQRLQITGERLRRYQVVRSKLRFESQLNDLFSGSLGLWLRCFLSKRLQD